MSRKCHNKIVKHNNTDEVIVIYEQIDPYIPWKIVVNSFSSLRPSGSQGGLIVYQ